MSTHYNQHTSVISDGVQQLRSQAAKLLEEN